MFVSMKSMLTHAHENYYAVMAINCVNFELVKAIVQAAEEEESAVIVNISPRQMRAHATPALLGPLIKNYAKKAKVPVALNLDHGQKYSDVRMAIDSGFSSIMYDGSSLSFEENAQNTSQFSLLAHDLGLSIEGELGHVGQAANGDNDKFSMYTDVHEAKQFVDATNVDCLAVAIGTAHGKYPAGVKPVLDFDRLALLKKELDLPLVLHGASGTSPADIKLAVKGGINKINVCTDVFAAGRDALLKSAQKNPAVDYMDMQHEAELAMKEYIKNYMQMIGSSGRYSDPLEAGNEIE